MTSDHTRLHRHSLGLALALSSRACPRPRLQPGRKSSRPAVKPTTHSLGSRCGRTAHGPGSRYGHTLIELVLVMIIMTLATLMGIRQFQLLMDRLAARDAVRAASVMVARARDEAVALHTLVSMRIDTATSALELRSRDGPIVVAPLRITHGVTLSTTRDSISFDVRGLGYGAANLTLVARRGRAADTLVVSRLGRTRW